MKVLFDVNTEHIDHSEQVEAKHDAFSLGRKRPNRACWSMYLKLTDQSLCVNLEMQFAFQLGNLDVLFEINIWGHSRSELGNNHNLRECFRKQNGE